MLMIADFRHAADYFSSLDITWYAIFAAHIYFAIMLMPFF